MIEACNSCHEAMGRGFIKVVKLKVPADPGINYKLRSEPGAVPKQSGRTIRLRHRFCISH